MKMQGYCDVFPKIILKRTSIEAHVYKRRHQGAKFEHFDVSNVIYHNFSHGAVFYTLHEKNVDVMLELAITQLGNDSAGALISDKQSGPQDQKNVTFLHSVISLNQLLQNSKKKKKITLLMFSFFSMFSETMSKYFSLRIFCIMFDCCLP